VDENILKTELFENDDVSIIIMLTLTLKGALKLFSSAAIIVAFSNFSGVVWTASKIELFLNQCLHVTC